MSQAGYWEQKLQELSTWNADVLLTHNTRIRTALDELSKALTNAMPDDLQGDVRTAADSAMAQVKLKATNLATKLTTVDTTVDSANSTRRTMAQDGMTTLENYPAKMEWWQESIVRTAVTGATITFGPLSWVASDFTADSINNYLANAREAEAQRQVKAISDAMDDVAFENGPKNQGKNRSDRNPGGGDPGDIPTSSYDSIPGAGYNPMNNSFTGQLQNQPQHQIGEVYNPETEIGTQPPVFTPNPPIVEPPYCGPWITPPEFPTNPVDPTNPNPFDPLNPPIGWTPDDPTGGGSTTWPRPTGPGGGGFGPGVSFGGGGAGGGGGAAMLGGAGGGVALGGAKLMAGTRTGAGLAGGLGSSLGGGTTGMMGGAGGAGGAAGRGGAAAATAAGRSGGMMAGAGGAGGAGTGSSAKGGAGRTGSGMMGGSGQGGSENNKKRRSGMGGAIAPSLDGDEEIGARSRAAEAGGRAPAVEFDE